jgi:hypothetical protein
VLRLSKKKRDEYTPLRKFSVACRNCSMTAYVTTRISYSMATVSVTRASQDAPKSLSNVFKVLNI